MDTEKDIYESQTEDKEPTNEPDPIQYYEPKSQLEKWLVATLPVTLFSTPLFLN